MDSRIGILALGLGLALALPVAAGPPSSLPGVANQNRLDSPRYQVSPFTPKWSIPLVRQSVYQPNVPPFSATSLLERQLRRNARIQQIDPTLRAWLDEPREERADDNAAARDCPAMGASSFVSHRRRLRDLRGILPVSRGFQQQIAQDNREVIRRLVELLDSGEIEQAATDAAAALEANVGDARLWFVFGFALYKRGDNDQAIEALRTSEELEYRPPSLYQVLGEALIANGQYADALEALDQAGDTGRQALSRAMALAELDRTADAMEAARTALARAPALAAESHLLIASLAVRMGDVSAASYNLQRSQDEAEERIEATGNGSAAEMAESASRLQQLLDRAPDPLEDAIDPHRRWTDQYCSGTTVVSAISWTDNDSYDSLGNDDLLLGIEARGWRRLRGDANAGLTGVWRIGSDFYAGAADSDDLLADVGLDAYKQYCNVSYGAYVGYRYTLVGGETFGHDVTSRLRVSLAERDWTQTSLLYQVNLRDVGFDVLPDEDRDGELHRIVLSQDFYWPHFNESDAGHSAILTPYAQWGRDQAQGIASQNDFWVLGLDGVAVSGNRRLYAGVSWQTRNFAQPHIRNLFLTSRDDNIWNARAGAAWQLSCRTTLACEWQLTTLDSLVDAFDFERNVFGLRFEWRPW